MGGWKIDEYTGRMVKVKDGQVDLNDIDKLTGTPSKVSTQKQAISSNGVAAQGGSLIKSFGSGAPGASAGYGYGFTNTAGLSTQGGNMYQGTLDGKSQMFTQDTIGNADAGSITGANVNGTQYNSDASTGMSGFQTAQVGIAGLGAVGGLYFADKNAKLNKEIVDYNKSSKERAYGDTKRKQTKFAKNVGGGADAGYA